MVRIGIVGIGFMGMIHYLAAQKLKGARVAAIHTRDPKKLAGDWTGIKGNFGPPGKKMDLGKVCTFREKLNSHFADRHRLIWPRCAGNSPWACLDLRRPARKPPLLYAEPS
jgi:hypothetical protein